MNRSLRNALTSGTLLSAAALGFIAASPNEAEAACCVAYDYTNEAQDTQDVKKHFESKLKETEQAIVDALKKMTGQLSANLKEQIAAAGQIADLQDKRERQRRIEDSKMEAIKEAQSAPSACPVASANMSYGTVKEMMRTWQRDYSEFMREWDKGEASEDGSKPASAAGKDMADMSRVIAAKKYDPKICEALGDCSDLDKDLIGAHELASKSLFSMNTYPENVQGAAQQFVVNATNPNPQGPLPKHFNLRSMENFREAAERQANRARMSLAEDYLAEVMNRRMPLENPELAETIEGMATEVSGYSPEGNNFPDGVSAMDEMEVMSSYWHRNVAKTAYLNELSPAALAKEQAIMMGFMIYQNWETYKLMEKVGSLLAVQASVEVENNRRVQ